MRRGHGLAVMEEDPQAEARHALRNHLTVIRGWAQLLVREGRKPRPDLVRIERYAASLEAGMTTLDQEILQRLAPRPAERDGHGSSDASGRPR